MLHCEDVWENGCIAPCILNLDVGSMVSCMHQLPYLWEGDVLVLLDRRLGGSQRQSGYCEEA